MRPVAGSWTGAMMWTAVLERPVPPHGSTTQMSLPSTILLKSDGYRSSTHHRISSLARKHFSSVTTLSAISNRQNTKKKRIGTSAARADLLTEDLGAVVSLVHDAPED